MKILHDDLPLFPLNTVLFPQARLPLQIFEPRYREMIDRCIHEDLAFGVVLIKEGDEVGAPAIPHDVGTLARIVDVARFEDGRMNINVAGVMRFKLLAHSTTHTYVTAQVEPWQDEDVDLKKAEGVARQAKQLFTQYARAIRSALQSEDDAEEETKLDFPKDPTVLSYVIAASLPVNNKDKQVLLQAPTVIARLRWEAAFLQRELELLRLVSDRSDRNIDQGSFSLN